MKKNILLFLLLISSTCYSFDFEIDYQKFKSGMELFDKLKFEEAKPLLSESFSNPNLTPDQRIYSGIALSKILDSDQEFSKSVSILEKASEIKPANSETDRDLNLLLATEYRRKGFMRLQSSYEISLKLLNKLPNDSSVIFNYAVACLMMAGHVEKQGHPEEKKKYFEESIKYSQKLITSPTDKNYIAPAYNLMGLALSREEKFDKAIDAYENAIKISDKAIYHRNLGWALFAGMAKKAKGKERLQILQHSLDEFNLAIKSGDTDKTTVHQIPRIKSEIDRLKKPIGSNSISAK